MARRLLTALALALVVSAVFTLWLGKKFAKSAHAAPVQNLYVAAAKNLDQGKTLATGDLKLVEWPASLALGNAFAKPEALTGRTLLFPVAAGEPILATYLAGADAVPGLSARIPKGMRAISLRSDEVAGVAGFAEPGTHVDVLVTSHSAGANDAVTEIVLQDVPILATGQNTQADPEGKATTADVVTLLVTPQDAEKVAHASAQGTIHFVLRNGGDREQIAGAFVAQSGLKTFEQPRSPMNTETNPRGPSSPSKAYSVLTVNGDKQTAETF